MIKQKKKIAVRKPLGAKTPLYVLSDSTGNLARHMVTSFLTQFPAGTFHVEMKPYFGEAERGNAALAAIAARPGIVLHAVVSPELKSQITRHCQKLELACYDMTGPVVEFLTSASRVEPIADHQRLHRVDRVYCNRINAMSYTLEHDDGLGLETLAEADIVLAGISRTGKTPTSIYLAMQGYRVANVSLAVEVSVPAQLKKLPAKKLVGLIINCGQLAEIRDRRQTAWQMPPTSYCDVRHVQKEIEWSRRTFTELGCPVLNVTDQAIEETAARVLDLLKLTEPAHRPEEGLS